MSDRERLHRRNVTFVAVNYRTLDLTRGCVESLLAALGGVHLLLVDNGSGDASTEYITELAEAQSNVRCILNRENRFHGPALHQGVLASETSFVFTLDSDTVVRDGGFLEPMLALFEDPNLYAAGCVSMMDRYGFAVTKPRRCYVDYVYPWAMLVDRAKYLALPGFVHHGSPCIHNMKAAERAGYRVASFPIERFIVHEGRGTCSRYGYGLSPMIFVRKTLSRLGILARGSSIGGQRR